jgi:hypothetical protein
MKKMSNEGNEIHNFLSSSGSGTVINYGSGSDFSTSYGSGSTSQKVTVPTVPVPQRWLRRSQSCVAGAESRGADIQLPPGAGAEITNCDVGSFLFINDFKKFYRKISWFLNKFL